MHTFHTALGSRARQSISVNEGSASVLGSSPNVDNMGTRLRGQFCIACL